MKEKYITTSLRLPLKLAKRLDEGLEEEMIDRTGAIRTAIEEWLDKLDQEDYQEATKQFVACKISESDYLDITGEKKVPSDVQEIRKINLAKLGDLE